MGLGEELRNARLEKNLTASEVAAATRMMVQIVEELEREDFHRFAAPIYGKGFIRLYAEFVGLDSRPLIDEYLDKFAADKMPSLKSESTAMLVQEEVSHAPQADTTERDDIPEKEPEAEGPGPEAQLPVESMPLVPVSDQEPDLFSRLEDANQPQPPPAAEPELDPESSVAPKAELPPVQSSQHILDEAEPAAPVKEPERPLWDETQGTIQEKIGRLRDARRWRKPIGGTGSFGLSSSPFRVLFVLGGVLLVLLVMIGLLNRCGRVPGASSGSHARDDRPTELRLVEDPPEPSFETE